MFGSMTTYCSSTSRGLRCLVWFCNALLRKGKALRSAASSSSVGLSSSKSSSPRALFTAEGWASGSFLPDRSLIRYVSKSSSLTKHEVVHSLLGKGILNKLALSWLLWCGREGEKRSVMGFVETPKDVKLHTSVLWFAWSVALDDVLYLLRMNCCKQAQRSRQALTIAQTNAIALREIIWNRSGNVKAGGESPTKYAWKTASATISCWYWPVRGFAPVWALLAVNIIHKWIEQYLGMEVMWA